MIPPNPQSGRPASSTVARYEEFLRRLIDKVLSNPTLWAKTAILVTVAAIGTAVIQTLDAFGQRHPRPANRGFAFVKKGVVDHTYTDHVSILKLIERNWRLEPLSARSRDRLPNPIVDGAEFYAPTNRPAIGDLMSRFQF